MVEVYSTWPRENNNIFLFKQNERKWDLFEDPIVSVSVAHDITSCYACGYEVMAAIVGSAGLCWVIIAGWVGQLCSSE